MDKNLRKEDNETNLDEIASDDEVTHDDLDNFSRRFNKKGSKSSKNSDIENLVKKLKITPLSAPPISTDREEEMSSAMPQMIIPENPINLDTPTGCAICNKLTCICQVPSTSQMQVTMTPLIHHSELPLRGQDIMILPPENIELGHEDEGIHDNYKPQIDDVDPLDSNHSDGIYYNAENTTQIPSDQSIHGSPPTSWMAYLLDSRENYYKEHIPSHNFLSLLDAKINILYILLDNFQKNAMDKMNDSNTLVHDYISNQETDIRDLKLSIDIMGEEMKKMRDCINRQQAFNNMLKPMLENIGISVSNIKEEISIIKSQIQENTDDSSTQLDDDDLSEDKTKNQKSYDQQYEKVTDFHLGALKLSDLESRMERSISLAFTKFNTKDTNSEEIASLCIMINREEEGWVKDYLQLIKIPHTYNMLVSLQKTIDWNDRELLFKRLTSLVEFIVKEKRKQAEYLKKRSVIQQEYLEEDDNLSEKYDRQIMKGKEKYNKVSSSKAKLVRSTSISSVDSIQNRRQKRSNVDSILDNLFKYDDE